MKISLKEIHKILEDTACVSSEDGEISHITMYPLTGNNYNVFLSLKFVDILDGDPMVISDELFQEKENAEGYLSGSLLTLTNSHGEPVDLYLLGPYNPTVKNS